jgi:hypothetical protein
MTLEDRVFLLEDALIQAQHTVQFLHGCLVNPSKGGLDGGFSYEYPEHTAQRLEDWAKLVPLPPMCPHSRYEEGCKSCQWHYENRCRLNKIREKESKS